MKEAYMELRKSVVADIESIMRIIRQAQESLKAQGVNQWQGNYPNEEVLLKDISALESYVLVHDDEIVATAMVTFKGEPMYDVIHDGEWLSMGEHATIHRIAVSNEHKGLGVSSTLLNCVEGLCIERDIHSIKIDTHRDNLAMQKVMEKNRFSYCGVVYVEGESDNERMAFEKLV